MRVFRHVTQRSVADAVRRLALVGIAAVAGLRGEVAIFVIALVALGVTLALDDDR